MRNIVLVLTKKPFDPNVHFNEEIQKYGNMHCIKIIGEGDPDSIDEIDDSRIGCIISFAGKEAKESGEFSDDGSDGSMMFMVLSDEVYKCSLEDREMLEAEGVEDPDCWEEEWSDLVINAINDYFEHYTLVEVDKEFVFDEE